MKCIRKPTWLIIALFFCSNAASLSAQTIKEFFNNPETPLLYLGIDYTLARVINDKTTTAIDIRDRYFPGINELIIKEPEKYDFARAFRKKTMPNDLSLVTKRNATIHPDSILSNRLADFRRLKKEDIDKLVEGFDFENKKGLGLLIVVEGMNKTETAASLWMTIVDMGTNKVLMTDRIEAMALGMSFRNYWASPFYHTVEFIKKRKYEIWKNKYGFRNE